MTESSPQLYVKTKLRLPSCIGSLSKAVAKVQQAWNELPFFRQKVGLPSTEELATPLLAKDKNKSRERRVQPAGTSTKRARSKKAIPEPIPVKISVSLEEWMKEDIL